MEQLLKKRAHNITQCILDKQEECPISGEYILPEYCPDIAVVLKCFAYPHIQNRQWSGEQMLLDGNAVIRVLYLDEERRCLRSLEFAQPFSCSLRGSGRVDNAAVTLNLSTKYLTCRALNPRRIEVRGVITVDAHADGIAEKDVLEVPDYDHLYARSEVLKTTVPLETCDKIMTISESLEFDASLPPAEMLLGGECCAVLKECKLLSGKAIVKGQIYLHQIYADSLKDESIHSLNYAIPFSQILDVEQAREGAPIYAAVHVLSDTEKCVVGPDGDNTMLEVNVKLLIQLHLYGTQEITILKDVYHSQYPALLQSEMVETCSILGTRWEESVLSLSVTMPSQPWKEILDLWALPQDTTTQCEQGKARIKGRMSLCVVARELDGEIVHHEFVEDYCLEYACNGNLAQIHSDVIGVKYRVVDNTLEVQIALSSTITDRNDSQETMVSDWHLQKEAPYPKANASLVLYYADAGESAWDIGKACHTSPQAIADENALTQDCLEEPMVLLVPISG